MTRIVVLGSINLDLTAATDRLPQPGETVTGATLTRCPGGKGANQALAASRLGADVTMLGAVGDDVNAAEALLLLDQGGVDLSRLSTNPQAATGVALIAVSESGENQIVVAPGANARFAPRTLDLPRADALICQLEIPQDTIVRAGREFDGFFCANLAPAKEVDVAVLQRADLLVVNEVEAAWYGQSLAACEGMIATTHGAKGAILQHRGEIIADAVPPVVEAIDTTGAGDAFTAAMTVALVEGQAPGDALRFACAAGAAATTKRGAQPSLPTRAEVEGLL